MRAFGFALIVVGIVVAVLGWQGKLGAAWTALSTGKAPGGTQPPPVPPNDSGVNLIPGQVGPGGIPIGMG